MTANKIKHPNLEHLAPETMQEYRACADELTLGLEVLADQPEETMEATLAALWHAAAGHPYSVQRAPQIPLPPLDSQGVLRLRTILRHRLEGMPLAHLTGRQQFMGVELIATSEALIPRRETELLGYAALEQLHAIILERGDASVIDVCTGSGNLALALAWHEPHVRVWGTDLSEEAITLARRNAAHAELGARVSFRTGDLLDPYDEPKFHARVDLIVCNPPYISSGKVDAMPSMIIEHEPRLAFDGGPFGIRILQRLINEAPRFLRAGGWLAVEVGLGQGQGIRHRLERHSAYLRIKEVLDQNGNVRVLLACTALDAGAFPQR